MRQRNLGEEQIKQFGGMGKQIFGFHKYKFEIPSGCPSGDVEGARRYIRVDDSGKIWPRDLKLGLVTIQTIYKAR